MKVIARNEGPTYNGSTLGCLSPGKEYKVISVEFPNTINERQYHQVYINGELKYNPKECKFYIKVIDDNNRSHYIYNDYFLSTEEVREMNLNKLDL